MTVWKVHMREPMSLDVCYPLPPSFYRRSAVEVARALVGMLLVRETRDGSVAGVIVETEAYLDKMDPASHAYRGKTSRNASMFGPPGIAYVYRSYGIHACLNVVAKADDSAGAVLIRAVQPVWGQELMRVRRGVGFSDRELCRGPGRLCQAFAISLADDGESLHAPALWVGRDHAPERSTTVQSSERIGISKGQSLPWRFYAQGNRFVSR